MNSLLEGTMASTLLPSSTFNTSVCLTSIRMGAVGAELVPTPRCWFSRPSKMYTFWRRDRPSWAASASANTTILCNPCALGSHTWSRKFSLDSFAGGSRLTGFTDESLATHHVLRDPWPVVVSMREEQGAARRIEALMVSAMVLKSFSFSHCQMTMWRSGSSDRAAIIRGSPQNVEQV
eukprot:CAMPEP_0173172360 /NCGR_PEP_ID=MMETSP1141-20130122/2265_1 /TAXON_ID=483371 /ORGANISM="non described non described, Strain CCMP2298" /LENGTH=177 /DNA_ID=CAMNT_0014094387 /DNA_START=1186 /DNA_END=1719 /DNA_ORIENTATION=+